MYAIIHRISFPSSSGRYGIQKIFSHIHEVHIYRFAITQLPEWLFTVMRLGSLIIDGDLSLDISPEFSQILEYNHGNIPPLLIPKEAKAVLWLEIYNSGTFPFRFDPTFCRENHVRHLIIDLTRLQTPLEDLGFFHELTDLTLSSHHRHIPTYFFLTPLTKIKKLSLYTELTHIPEVIQFLHAIEELILDGNLLED